MSDIITRELAKQEEVIEVAYNKYITSKDEIALALRAIKEKKLYLVGYKSFNEYCKERWGFSKSTAYLLLGTGEDTVKVGNKCPKSDTNCLSSQSDQDGSDDTYDDVLIVFDQAKKQVPPELAKRFDKANKESEAMLGKVYELNAAVIAQVKDDDDSWARFNRSKVMACLADVKSYIKFSRPWATCPTCGGDGNLNMCATCHGSGWLIYNQYNTIPDDEK